MQTNEALTIAAEKISQGDIDSAKEIINTEYPFTPVKKEGRNYTTKQMMEQFCKDGFIDRYSGEELINPGMLRVMSELMPEEFPFHAHWKTDECHIAYWDYQPTVDHIYPIALGGVDAPENWASTSMVNNSAKSNFTLEQLGWTLKAPGKISEWDGLSRRFVQIVEDNNGLLDNKKIKEWYSVTKAVMKDVL